MNNYKDRQACDDTETALFLIRKLTERVEYLERAIEALRSTIVGGALRKP